MATLAVCKISDCDKGGKLTRGWCGRHYSAWRRHGDPLAAAKRGPKGPPPNSNIGWLKDHKDTPDGDCLVWPFQRNAAGYGKIRHRGRQTRASRVMCELVHGAPPSEDHEAAHSCGKGHSGCVHPRHLRWATRAENAADAVSHGTWVHGSKVKTSKLVESEVREIRRLAGTMLQRDIAARFGVSRRAISLILSGKNWAWLN